MRASSHRRVGQFAIVVFAFVFASGLARAHDIQVCFSPPLPEGCDATKTVVQTLDAAQHQVLVQTWGLVSAPIARALVEAQRRVLDVRVILDKSALRRRDWHPTVLEQAGVLLLIDAEHAIAHSNIIIVDRHTLITGSFNFTRAAQERNAEDLVLIRSPTLAAQYVRKWNSHAAHSQPVRTQASISPLHYAAPGDAEGENQHGPTVRPIVENCRSLDYAQAVRASRWTMVREHPVVFAGVETREAAKYAVRRSIHPVCRTQLRRSINECAIDGRPANPSALGRGETVPTIFRFELGN
jgi:phosphatidylserine/phosphatidylglycerophosphate/cardiolipin synthase-like enzyme